MDVEKIILDEYAKNIELSYNTEESRKTWYPMYYRGFRERSRYTWVQDNQDAFLKGTPNKINYNRWYFSESSFITALQYSPNGAHIIVGHSSGMIQMRHGNTGTVLCTLRNIQFPPKPIYSIEYSTSEERVCYASCMDGVVYRIEIPNIDPPLEDPPAYCIKADPALETLNMQFYGSPGISSYATPFISQRSPALSLGLSYDETKIIVGYGDASIKVYDKETQEVRDVLRTDRLAKMEVAVLSPMHMQLSHTLTAKEDIVRIPACLRALNENSKACLTYKVHKLRLQFIPKKLQRMHFGQVCALRCHKQKPYMFASGAWDKTLRIWDTRCQVGCVMTFEGVDICSDSIDLNRDHCIAGSWQPTDALTVWDLVARKKLSVVRVQNRRPDIDGEYIYACRYWQSADYNRKGKYGIIGGSGTNCVEVINLHNRYIACSYPASGTVLAVASHQHRIAFGGTAPTLTIVSFFDPKHEKDKYDKEKEPEMDYTKPEVTLYEDVFGNIDHGDETDRQ